MQIYQIVLKDVFYSILHKSTNAYNTNYEDNLQINDEEFYKS